MGNDPEFGGTLWEALEWMEYVNGPSDSNMGRLRVANGINEPYNVKYWCIGNENYGPWGKHSKESDTTYANKLYKWAHVIKEKHPNIHLLGVGRSLKWNEEVLKKNGELLDYLTQHYYVTSKIKDDKIQNAQNTLFAPAKMEAHIHSLGSQLDDFNAKLNRSNPLKLSIDEWNNRHSVFQNEKYTFTRHSPRRMFDVPVIAGMLNAFIRQSKYVGMANYIFPVNAHGLIRTVGSNDAFETSIYHVFKYYRENLVGNHSDYKI